MEIPSLCFLVVAPGGLLYAGKHHSLSGAGRFSIGPYIPVAELRISIGPRIAKPVMLVRGMIHHKVNEHANSALLRSMREFHEIAEGAEGRIDPIVVGNIVTIVLARRRLKWHEPDSRHAEPLQIVEPA